MSDEEIEILKAALKKPGCKIFWIPDSSTVCEVYAIGKIKDEPGPVAMCMNGKYLALWNCDVGDFKEAYPLKE